MSDGCCSRNLSAGDLATVELLYMSHVAVETHIPTVRSQALLRDERDPANWHSAVMRLSQC